MDRREHEAEINARQSAVRQQSRVPPQQSQQQQQQHMAGHPGVGPTAFVEPGQPLALTPAPPMHAQHQLQQQPHAQRMEKFWMDTYSRIQHELFDYKSNQNLPLARIKKVMKTDEEVKMISSEVPVLFAKACDIFIMDITLRAWLFAEECKRRTLQRSDIANSIRRVDMFDFLIDIVPRDEKPPAKTEKLEYNDQPAAYPYGYGVPQGGQYPSEDQKIMVDSMVAYHQQQQQMRYMQIDQSPMMHETHPQQGAQPHHHEHHPHAFHAQPGSSATHPQYISDTPPAAAGQPAAGYQGGYYQQSPAVQQAFSSHQSDQHRHPHAPHAHPHQHDQHATPHATQPGASHHPHVPGPHGHGNDVAPVKYEYDPIPGPNEWYHPATSSSGVPTHGLGAGYVQEANQAGQPLGPGAAAPGFNHSVDGRSASLERK